MDNNQCRICLKVCDPKNVKNVFYRANSQVLAIAEELLGETLERRELAASTLHALRKKTQQLQRV